jgi:hypothetical protein
MAGTQKDRNNVLNLFTASQSISDTTTFAGILYPNIFINTHPCYITNSAVITHHIDSAHQTLEMQMDTKPLDHNCDV